MTIKDLIEEYEHALDTMEEEAEEQNILCNSYLAGRISAYKEVLDDLYDMNWGK